MSKFLHWLVCVTLSAISVIFVSPLLDTPTWQTAVWWGFVVVGLLCFLKFVRKWLFPAACIGAAIFISPHVSSPQWQIIIQWGFGSIGVIMFLGAFSPILAEESERQAREAPLKAKIKAENKVKELSAKRDVKGLSKALEHKEFTSVRQAAAVALGEIGDPQTVQPLVTVLKDAERSVRIAAAEALGKIKEASAVQPLSLALSDKEGEVREAAAQALGQIGDGRAIVPICAALANGYVRLAGVEALDKLGWQPDKSEAGAVYWIIKDQWAKCVEIGSPAVKPLTVALANRYHKETVARTLGQIGDARAVQPLITVLTDSSESNRQAAVRALTQIGTPAVESLIAALTDISGDVRHAAAQILAQIRDKQAVEPLIAALTDKEERVRWAVAEALDNLGWQPDRSETGAAYWIAKQEWNRCVEVGVPAIKLLITTLTDTNENVRKKAALTLGSIGDKQAVEALIAALKDMDESVGSAAAKALGQIGDARAKEPLTKAYMQGSPAAAEGLVRLGDADIVPKLITNLNNGSKAERRNAATALVNIYKAGEIDEPLKRLILAQRGIITKQHYDHHRHDDGLESASSDCRHEDSSWHDDSGIGITFPV